MDLRKFSVFIMILGVIIAGYGAYKIIALYAGFEEALSSDQIQNPDGSVTVRIVDEDEYKKTRNEFKDRYFGNKKDLPIIIIIAGGIVLFIGIAVRVSAKKSEQ